MILLYNICVYMVSSAVEQFSLTLYMFIANMVEMCLEKRMGFPLFETGDLLLISETYIYEEFYFIYLL